MMYFFDLDGTLLDSNGIWLDIDTIFLAQHGISPVPEDYTNYVSHHSFWDAAEYTRSYFHLTSTSEEIMAIWQEMAQQAYAQQLPLKPEARAFLERSKKAGKRQALLTSCMPTLCQAALEHHGLHPLFEEVFTSTERGLDKGNPQLYRELAKGCGQRAEDCILFDDSPVYCAAAKEAGWQVYGVSDPLFAHRAEEMATLCGPGHYPFSFSDPLP